MLLLSPKVVLLYTCTTFVAAVLLVAPLCAVEGVYVDKPVCDGDNGVCTCKGTQVVCKKDLPEPARWKDLDSKWVDIHVSADDLTKLEKGAFDGLSARNLFIQDMTTLSAIEEGTFKGLQLSQELRLYRNPKLAALSKGTFVGLISCEIIRVRNNGITKIEEGAFSGIDVKVGNIWIEEHDHLTAIEKRAFKGFRVGTINLVKNSKLQTLVAFVFDGLETSSSFFIGENDILSDIKVGAFNGLEASEVHIDDHKKLTTLPSGVFSGMKAEQTSYLSLFLRGNGLIYLSNGLFKNIIGRKEYEGLYQLDIENHKALSSLEAGTFDGCIIQRYLRFIKNAIATLGPNVFNGLSYKSRSVTSPQL